MTAKTAGAGSRLFPIEFANDMARLESYNKHLYRPNSYLHKWWARRCGSTFRLILKHLVDDPGRADYYSPGGLEGVVILDPMMGGGTTLHEAIRLGANVIGADIDPIPVLQARATLSAVPLADLETAFETFYRSLYSRLSPLFQTTCPHCAATTDLTFTLYGQQQRCACGRAILVDSTVIRHGSDGRCILLCDRCGDLYEAGSPDQEHNCAGRGLDPPVYPRSVKRCPTCNQPFAELLDLPFYARYLPVTVAGHCPHHGFFFKAPTPADLALIARADRERNGLALLSLPGFEIQPGPKSADLINHQVHSYPDLFSSRQLFVLDAALDALAPFTGLVKLNLGLLLSTSTEFNSMLCGYKGGSPSRPGAIRHTFSLHAYSFPYTALENNPLNPRPSSGTLRGLFHARIRRGRQWAVQPIERKLVAGRVTKVAVTGERDIGQEVQNPAGLSEGKQRFLLVQNSSAHLDLADESVDHIVTDPPYYDNVQYGDLSAFFRVWLQQIFPAGAQWDYELDDSAVDPPAVASGRFEAVLGAIFQECYRVLRKPGGRLIFTFHHWRPRGWAALTNALGVANFVLLERYVIHAENPASVHIASLRSLHHDAILVFGARRKEGAAPWPPPEQVDTSSSEAFIADCADALGWMLSAGLEPAEVRQRWEALFAEKGEQSGDE